MRGGALGDLILTLPAIDALRRHAVHVDILANSAFQSLLRNCVGVDAVYALDSAVVAPLFVNDAQLDAKFRAWLSGFDCVISYLHDVDGIAAANLRRIGNAQF